MTPRAVLLVVTCAVGVVAQGGFYPSQRWALGALLAVAAVLTEWSGTWRRWDVQLLLLAVASSAWTTTSLVRGAASDDVLAVVLSISACVLVLLIARRLTIEESRVVLRGLVAVGVVTSVVGLVGVLAHQRPWAEPALGLWRAAAGTSYANATGVLLVMIALVALSLLVADPYSPLLAGASALLLAGAGATLSRGAALAGLVAVGAFLVLAGRMSGVLIGPLLGAGLVLAGLAPAMSATRGPGPWWATVTLVAGPVLAGWLARRRLSTQLVAAVAMSGLVATAGWLSHPALSSRLSLETPRWDTWAAARPVIAAHVLDGVGPGRVWVAWVDAQGASRGTALLHNEYLQALAEVGVVGVLLLVTIAVVVLAPLRRSLHRPVSSTVLAAVTASTALVVACAGDIVGHLTLLPILAALLLGMALAEALGPGPDTTGTPTRTAAPDRVHRVAMH